MADKSLIEGAARLGKASMGPDIAGAVRTGLEAGFKPFFEWQKKEKAWQASVAPKLAKIGEDYSPTLVDEGQRATMAAALQESRLKYADILKQTRNMDPTSEEYINLMGQATDIVAGFNKTFELGQEFTKLGNEFAILAQNENLSGGMTAEKKAGLAQIFVNGNYKVKRDPVTGQMTYTVTENVKGPDGTIVETAGMEFAHDELDDFRMPNQSFVNKYLSRNENFSKIAEKGKKLNMQSAEYKNAAFEVQAEISNMNIEDLRSLATDGFIDGKPIAVFSQEEGDIFNMSKAELGAKVYQKLMNNLLETNATNYKAPAPKGREVSSYEQAQSLYNQLKQNPIGYFEAYTGVAPVWDRKTNIVEIYEGGELQFKYDLNNPAQRGGFYKQLLDASDYLKGTSAKEEETRRIFDMLVMAGARGSSPTAPGSNTKPDDGKKPPAPPTIEERADQAFNSEEFSTDAIKEEILSGELNRNEKFFINQLSKTKADITEKDIAEAVYNSSGRQIITIFGKEYKPKALYKKDIKLQSKDQEDFENYLNASTDPNDVPRTVRNKYKDNEYLNELNITDISQLTYKDIEKIKLLEKNISLGDIDIAEKQEKFKSKKIT